MNTAGGKMASDGAPRRPHFIRPSANDQSLAGTSSNALYLERDTEDDSRAESGTYLYNNPYLSMSIQQQRSRLPIFKV